MKQQTKQKQAQRHREQLMVARGMGVGEWVKKVKYKLADINKYIP